MSRMARRSCTSSCLGCLLPVIAVVGLLLFAVHQITTAPTYATVSPASPQAVELAALKGLEQALATQQPVALIELNDSELTALLREGLSGSEPLSNLQVHVLGGQLILTGDTAILSHPLVVSGPVQLTSGGGALVDVDFSGLWVGQLGFPALLPQLVSRGLHPQFNLTVAAGHDGLSFACDSVRQNELVVGLRYSSGPDPDAARACSVGT